MLSWSKFTKRRSSLSAGLARPSTLQLSWRRVAPDLPGEVSEAAVRVCSENGPLSL